MKAKKIIEYLEMRFPSEIASEFDLNSIGLIIGNEQDNVNGIFCTLDLTLDAAREAKNKNCNFIISHHPLLFNPIYKINLNEEKGAIINYLIKNNLLLYSMHTNLDAGKKGVNDVLGRLLKIDCEDYEIARKDCLMRAGLVKQQTLKQFAEFVKEVFKLTAVRVVGDPDKKINKVGIIGGSGAHVSEIKEAIDLGCDCYISGEIKLPVALTAHYNQLALIEIPHGVEKLVFNDLKEELENHFKILVDICSFNTDPFYII